MKHVSLALVAWMALLLACTGIWQPVQAATGHDAADAAQATGAGVIGRQAGPDGPIVSDAVSPANNLDLPPVPPVMAAQGTGAAVEPREMAGGALLPARKTAAGQAAPQGDAALQTGLAPNSMPNPSANFEGVTNLDGVYPPDTDGSAGPNHYVQMVNLHTAVYNKSGTLLYGPFLPSKLWPAGDPCNRDDGDPVVLYDRWADRWYLSQFALPNYPSGPFYECIAVSKGSIPTNVPADWYVYSFNVSATKMNDYPKLAIWPDGLYMSENQFYGGSNGHAGAIVFDRAKMLLGQAATFQYFDLTSLQIYSGQLPVDLEGPIPPPTGTPAYFLEVDDAALIGPSDAMRIWQFHVDWNNPASSTYGTATHDPNYVLPVASFDLLPCVTGNLRSCIPQQGTGVKLDAVADRLMFRATYRNFGDHSAVVVNHTVKADGTDRAGIRWYEIRSIETSPSIYQQGTYAPADGLYRWMGSITTDHVGNMALGYSVSSAGSYPSIRYTGRLAGDPAGQMAQGEASVMTGTGAQTGTGSRWGDYSAMSIDPVDDCTFWYTQEYIATTGPASWQTRIAAFKFPTCTAGSTGVLTGTVTGSGPAQPIEHARVQATDTTGHNTGTNTNASGGYSLVLPVGTYTVNVSAYGYVTTTFTGQAILQSQTTTLNAALVKQPEYLVTGKVFDQAAGWPVYARITVDGWPGAPFWTDPTTGAYSITLAAGTSYTFNAAPFVAGYLAGAASAGPLTGNLTLNIAVQADSAACSAPGYIMQTVCHPVPGGIVAGRVVDGNNSQPLVGASVMSDTGGQATTAATPLDPAQGDYYVLFQPVGTHTLTAAMPQYTATAATVAVPVSNTIRHDFSLPAGRLAYTPPRINEVVKSGSSRTLPMTVTNSGSSMAHFELLEFAGGLAPTGPFETPDIVTKPWRWDLPTTAEALPPRIGPVPPYAAGDIIQNWTPVGAPGPWGIAYNSVNSTVWVSSPSSAWGGNDRIYEYQPGGTPTGRSWLYSPIMPHSSGPADLTFNWKTGMIWAMNINSGVSNCIYEINPASGPTGNKICPGSATGFTNSQRGLAYDPENDTWFAGGWNDQMVYRFRSDGTILASKNVGINIAGLAYNPDTGHLFALQNTDGAFYVLDVNNDYNVLGQFFVSGLTLGAGLEFDCDGKLWAVDNATSTVYRIDSGETAALCQRDVSWLSETPVQATLAPGQSTRISVTLDSTGLANGIYRAQLGTKQDTPYIMPGIPVMMTVTGATPVLIDAALHEDSTTGAYDVRPVSGGPAGVYTLTARFTNTSSSPISRIYFEMTALTAGNLLLNADGGPGGAGSQLTVPSTALGPNGVLDPNEQFAVIFRVGLQSHQPFTFTVDAYGSTIGQPGGSGFQFSITRDKLKTPNGAYLPILRK